MTPQAFRLSFEACGSEGNFANDGAETNKEGGNGWDRRQKVGLGGWGFRGQEERFRLLDTTTGQTSLLLGTGSIGFRVMAECCFDMLS